MVPYWVHRFHGPLLLREREREKEREKCVSTCFFLILDPRIAGDMVHPSDGSCERSELAMSSVAGVKTSLIELIELSLGFQWWNIKSSQIIVLGMMGSCNGMASAWNVGTRSAKRCSTPRPTEKKFVACQACQEERRSKKRVIEEGTGKPQGFANAKSNFCHQCGQISCEQAESTRVGRKGRQAGALCNRERSYIESRFARKARPGQRKTGLAATA